MSSPSNSSAQVDQDLGQGSGSGARQDGLNQSDSQQQAHQAGQNLSNNQQGLQADQNPSDTQQRLQVDQNPPDNQQGLQAGQNSSAAGKPGKVVFDAQVAMETIMLVQQQVAQLTSAFSSVIKQLIPSGNQEGSASNHIDVEAMEDDLGVPLDQASSLLQKAAQPPAKKIVKEGYEKDAVDTIIDSVLEASSVSKQPSATSTQHGHKSSSNIYNADIPSFGVASPNITTQMVFSECQQMAQHKEFIDKFNQISQSIIKFKSSSQLLEFLEHQVDIFQAENNPAWVGIAAYKNFLFEAVHIWLAPDSHSSRAVLTRHVIMTRHDARHHQSREK